MALTKTQIAQIGAAGVLMILEYERACFMHRLNFLDVEYHAHPGTFKEFAERNQDRILDRVKTIKIPE